MTKYAVVCSWCPDAKECTRVLTTYGYVVSHTICANCTRDFEADEFGDTDEDEDGEKETTE